MTKSTTTFFSAGNICTNVVRSVFFFVTETIVDKPNVISGVTATYIFTTTNSKCFEVNDFYTDLYFTVSSNIYLFDQGNVLQLYKTGYYFINTAKNILVSENDTCELVLAQQDIKNRGTGECYNATSITNFLYGYSQYLYNMNIYSTLMVDETGYYIVNLSTITTVVSMKLQDQK